MLPAGSAVMLRIYLGDADRSGGKTAYRAIVELLRTRGLAGATVLHGIEGFGTKQHLHTDRILTLSVDLPVVIEVIDTEDHIRAVLPALDDLVGDGLIVLSPVEVVAHRSGQPDPGNG
jgi:PII-like signaling protein